MVAAVLLRDVVKNTFIKNNESRIPTDLEPLIQYNPLCLSARSTLSEKANKLAIHK